MADQKIIELLRKLKYRAEHGVNENETASAWNILRSKMEKYGVTEQDLEGLTTRKIPVSDIFVIKIIAQYLRKYLNVELSMRSSSYWSIKSKVTAINVDLTDQEYEAVTKALKIYVPQFKARQVQFKKKLKEKMKAEQEAFEYAFLADGGLLLPASEDAPPTPASELRRILEALGEYDGNHLQRPNTTLENQKLFLPH